PDREDRRNLLQRDPLERAPRVDRSERPDQRLQDKPGPLVGEHRRVEVLPRGKRLHAEQHIVERGAPCALTRGAERLAGRGGDESVEVMVTGDEAPVITNVALNGGKSGCAASLAGGMIELDSEYVEADVGGRDVPSAWTGEQVDSLSVGRHAFSPCVVEFSEYGSGEKRRDGVAHLLTLGALVPSPWVVLREGLKDRGLGESHGYAW